LKWKYGQEEIPNEVKAKTLEDVKAEEELIKKAKAGLLMEKPQKEVPAPGPGLRTFNVFVDGDYFEVGIEDVGGSPVITSIAPVAPQPASVAPRPVTVPPPPKAAAAPAPGSQPAPPQKAAVTPAAGTAIEAPMPGMIIRFEVDEGASVKEDDVVLILEAMKMENSITSPVSGTVKQIGFKAGDTVQKGDVLVVIG
jgi:pyruvate carboxylase subunit B